MGRYNFQSPGAAAGNAIEQFLLQRALEERQRREDELKRQREAAEAARAGEELTLRKRNADLDERRIAGDEATRTFNQGRQTQQDDIAAGERRQAQNQIGVRQMMTQGLRTGAADPREIQLQAYGEGVEIPQDVLDPGAAARTRTAEDERNHRQRLEEIAAQGRESRSTVAANRSAANTVGVTPDAQGTANTLALLDRFEKHPGTPKAYGIVNSRLSGFSPDAQNAISVRDQLVAALTLPNLGVLKGPASDNDVRFMKQMSSRLTNSTIDMREVQAAINETRAYLQRRQAEEAGMGRTPGAGGNDGGVVRWGRDAQGRPVRVR